MRKKNTYANVLANIVYTLVIMAFTFVNRKVFLTQLNVTYFGLNSLCVDILSMLSLAELGIGQAMVYALYKPFAKNDKPTIKAYLKIYRVMYRYVALTVLGIGIILLFFLPILVKEEVDMKLVYTVFLLYLLNSVVSYLLSYKRSVLFANQQAYKMVYADMIFKVMSIACQIAVLLLTRDMITYVLVVIVFTIGGNVYVNRMVIRKYPFLRNLSDAAGISPAQKKDVIKNVKALSIHNLGNFCVKNTDNIIISYFLTLGVVGIFSNYMFLVVSIGSIIAKIFDAATASIGNLIVEKDEAKTYSVFNMGFFINFIVALWVTALVCTCMQVLITLWLGEEYLFPDMIVYLISGYLYLQLMRSNIYSFKTASGIFDQDKFFPVLQSVANLGLSVLLVHWLGVSGIFIAKIVISFFLINWVHAFFTYKYTLNIPVGRYFEKMFVYSGTTFLICVFSVFICSRLFPEYCIVNLIYRVLCTSGIVALITILLFHKTKEYRCLINLISEQWNKFRPKSA